MITDPSVRPGDLGFGAFVRNRTPVGPPLPPSSWQPPPRYYAGPPAAKPFTTPVSSGPVAVNRPPTVNNAYTPGANYRPVNRTATPAPSVSAPLASPVALKGLPRAPQFKAPQIPGGGNLGPALGAAAMLPSLVSALGSAAGDSRNLARTAVSAGQNPGRGNLTAALAIPFTAPFAVAGIASRNGRPDNVPAWLWPFPDPPGPNDLDPAAMNAGPEISPGVGPPFLGGQSAVLYTCRVNYNLTVYKCSDGTTVFTGSNDEGLASVQGPIQSMYLEDINPSSCGFRNAVFKIVNGNGAILSGGTLQGTSSTANRVIYSSVSFSVVRQDGQPDTGGNLPNLTEPVSAPNPARQVPADAPPRTLQAPTPAPAPSDLPWPQTAPQTAPQPAPFADPQPAPNFTATPAPDPLPLTAPGTTSTPTDLDAPRETPPNLADDPLTPPVDEPLKPIDESKPTGWLVNGKPARFWGGKATVTRESRSSEEPQANRLNPVNFTTAALAVAVPVVLLDGLRQKVNTPSASLANKTATNPNIKIVTPPPPPTVSTPNPPTCIYERERVRDIQNKTTDVQGRAANPVSGFPGLYGLQIEARTKLGQTFTLLETVNNFMRKAWKMSRIQKVLNAMTLITVLHNASMISRDVGETLGYALSQGLDVLGIDDEEGNALDVNSWFGTQANNFFENIFGAERWHGLNETWNKANRIISSATMIVWTLRSIHDGTQEVLEWTAENTGKIGNALKKWGVVGERAYPWMAERVKAQDAYRRKFSRILDGLETAEEAASSYGMVISEVNEITQEIGELGEQRQRFAESVRDMAPNSYPDNSEFLAPNEQAGTNARSGPEVTPVDMEPGNSGTP